jgi:hypothetical protein
MLHLVPTSPNPAPPSPNDFSKKHADFIKQINTPGFFCDFKEISPQLFSFYAQDASHGLVNFFSLEIQDSFDPILTSDAPSVSVLTCDFPAIDGYQLSKIVLGDEYLETVLMFQFHLKVLDALFLFGMDRDIEGLTLTVDRDCADRLYAYSDFVVSKAHVMTKKGRQTQLTIRTDAQTYDALIELIEVMEDGFRQSLWREQRDNPAIRLYLKSHALATV